MRKPADQSMAAIISKYLCSKTFFVDVKIHTFKISIFAITKIPRDDCALGLSDDSSSLFS